MGFNRLKRKLVQKIKNATVYILEEFVLDLGTAVGLRMHTLKSYVLTI